MMELNISAMSCGHCVRAVTEAVQQTDPRAKVEVDLGTHRVRIESTAPREAIVAALREAGYQPD